MDGLTFYLAAPCFSSAERRWNQELKTVLDNYCNGMGFYFYLPQDHVQESWSSERINTELTHGLKTSDGVIANLDGPGGDDGTCWEMGFVSGMNAMALGLGRPKLATRSIFWYRTDFRRGGDSLDNVNLMMAHSARKIGLDGTSVSIVASSIQKALVRVYGATRPEPLFREDEKSICSD